MYQPPIGKPLAKFDSLNLADLRRLADSFCSFLPRGMVMGLVGTLGAGKTTFVQSIATAAGVDPAEVTSPTFTLLQSHAAKFTIHHLDTYRLADDDEFLELGVEELFDDPDAWTMVEWADRMPEALPPETLWVCFQLSDEDDLRDIAIYSDDPRAESAIESIKHAMETSDGDLASPKGEMNHTDGELNR